MRRRNPPDPEQTERAFSSCSCISYSLLPCQCDLDWRRLCQLSSEFAFLDPAKRGATGQHSFAFAKHLLTRRMGDHRGYPPVGNFRTPCKLVPATTICNWNINEKSHSYYLHRDVLFGVNTNMRMRPRGLSHRNQQRQQRRNS